MRLSQKVRVTANMSCLDNVPEEKAKSIILLSSSYEAVAAEKWDDTCDSIKQNVKVVADSETILNPDHWSGTSLAPEVVDVVKILYKFQDTFLLQGLSGLLVSSKSFYHLWVPFERGAVQNQLCQILRVDVHEVRRRAVEYKNNQELFTQQMKNAAALGLTFGASLGLITLAGKFAMTKL